MTEQNTPPNPLASTIQSSPSATITVPVAIKGVADQVSPPFREEILPLFTKLIGDLFV